MNTMRMPQGWVLVGTNALEYGNIETKYDNFKRMRELAKMTHNFPKRKIEDMEEDANKSYNEKLEYEAQLREAYNAKKLCSQRLIDKVKSFGKR